MYVYCNSNGREPLALSKVQEKTKSSKQKENNFADRCQRKGTKGGYIAHAFMQMDTHAKTPSIGIAVDISEPVKWL